MKLKPRDIKRYNKIAEKGRKPVMVRVGNNWYTWYEGDPKHGVFLTTQSGRDVEFDFKQIDDIEEGVEKLTKSKLKEIIREVINEKQNPPFLEGDVFKAMWEKALKYAKSAGIWSPHIAQSNKTDPVGKYNRDFWDSFRSKGDDVVTFGYHLDSASYAFKNGIWVKDLYLLWGTAATKDDLEGNLSDGKKIVKVLNKAGFKAYLPNPKSAIKLSARFTAKSL
jgi:hypothetical protein